MARTTIDFGIDLGTTNSAIAVLRGTDTEVFRNNENHESTPSVVWIDKTGNLNVGVTARSRLGNDWENAYGEFKSRMGSETEYVFARSNRRMRPEELSAEVLKSLRADVNQRMGEDVTAAVITVPAAFDMPSVEATNRAAQLAGITQSPLLQEPVAAGLAYSFQSNEDKAYWLVFDLGGGTFDAAVIQLRDGLIQVVHHNGDNHLGGKHIDQAIVDQFLIPAICREFALEDFRRGNEAWRRQIDILTRKAEDAKIGLSRNQSYVVEIEDLCKDRNGKSVSLEVEIKRGDVERIAEPFFARAINICRKTLAEKRLAGSNIDKVLLVGGPTLTPFLRERLSDPKAGLGIPLDYSIDPMTVVARGAAIFAGTQRLEAKARPTAVKGEFSVRLEYSPVGPETEPLVGGQVAGTAQADLSGFTIEFINKDIRPEWRSGRIGLAPDGTFMTNLWAEKGKQNTFRIELRDPKGKTCRVGPDSLQYTVGQVVTEPPLTHSIGVALANNEKRVFIEKGTPLPARYRSVHKTAFDARKGQQGEVIRIPVVAGESPRADRNRLVGELVISSEKFKRDLLAGSEIEITIDINESQIAVTKAYIPVLDEDFEAPLRLKLEPKPTPELQKELVTEQERLKKVREAAANAPGAQPPVALRRIDEERMMYDIEQSLGAANTDPDAARKCDDRLLDLKLAIDEAEAAVRLPSVIADAETRIRDVNAQLREQPNAEYGKQAAALEAELRQAIGSGNADVIQRKLEALTTLHYLILRERPGFWVGLLRALEDERPTMTDRAQADLWINQGNRAINQNDLEGLKSAVRQLLELLPTRRQQEFAKGYGSTVL
jgi:molecular chaperone DnaK